MKQDLTLDEIAWRYEILRDSIDEDLKEKSIELTQEDKDLRSITDFMQASLIYLQRIGAIAITLHKGPKFEGALFTATRLQCKKTSWIEPEDFYFGHRPSQRAIPVPVLFEEEGNEVYTHISLTFDFPDTNIGHFCERMIDYLRQSCRKDVNVINAVVFMDKYFTTESYIRCCRAALILSFTYDFWTSLPQTPNEIEKLMEWVLEDDICNLYDPFMRTGTNFIFSNGKYHAQATDKYHFYATMICAGLCGIDTESMEMADCVSSWDPRDCDTIIATPEFNMEVANAESEIEPIGTWALEKVFNSMGVPNRKSLLLLPASVLTSSGKVAKLRHDIIESNLLDTVVLLPANLFPKTSIAATIILLKSNRDNNTVTLADFSSLEIEPDDWDDDSSEKPILDIESIQNIIDSNNSNYICHATLDEIREQEYQWYVPKYVHKQIETPVGFEYFKINSLLKDYVCAEVLAHIVNLRFTDSKLVSNPFDNYSSLDSIPFYEESTEDEDEWESLDNIFASQSCFVIDFENSLKTYYYERDYDDFLGTIKVPMQYHCYHINPDMVHIGYLRMILHNLYDEIKRTNPSASMNEFVKLFMNSTVLIPLDLGVQKSLYEQAKLNYALDKARKEGLDEAINSMREEYMMEVRMRKHDMKPFLSQLDSQAKLISFYMDKIEGNESTVMAIRQKLLGISNAVSELRLHLNRLTEEDIYGSAELINPLDILKELIGDFSNYSVDLEVDAIALKEAGIDTPEIYISKVDFSTLATTIIENAVTHAFSGDGKDYKILISLTYDKVKSEYIIDFSNNGSSMPIGMDKFRYGLKGEKGAKSKGSGLGGYRVKSITRHFGGDYDVFCNRIHNSTTIRISFPKYNAYE